MDAMTAPSQAARRWSCSTLAPSSSSRSNALSESQRNGVPPTGVHFFDQRAHEVVVAADGFDEDVFAGLEVAGKRDQPVRELLDARIEHMGYLRY